MKIDITQEPPADIFRDRGKYLRIAITLLSMVVCGGLLLAYGIIADAPHNEPLQTTGLSLFIVPGLVFVYFAEKLKAYKKLNPEERKKLAELGRTHLVIGTYCALVGKEGREPIMAEYEACKDWVENLELLQ